MRKVSVLILIFFISLTCFSQNAKNFQQEYKVSNGKYIVSYYANNIIKLTFTPTAYTKNENVSDAVILKPINTHSTLIKIKDDVVLLNDKPLIINTDTANGFHTFNFALAEDEKIFGGGERALPLNRRGYHFNLYNNPWYGYGEGADNLNYAVPFFTSSKGYALFFDNPSKGFVDIGKADKNTFTAGFSSGELNVYIIAGNNYQQILQSYHKLTGTQPLPPRWAFGNLMSRFGYTSEAQVKDILLKMENEHIPVDAIIFDLFWFGDSIKGTLGNLEWINKHKWDDPKKMIGDFRKKGINTILVTEPFFVETSKNYQSSKKYLSVDASGKPYYLTDFYFGKGGLIDIFRKDSKDWFWNFYKKQMDIGVEAWWGDLGEPERHPSNMYHNLKDFGYKRLFAADEVHNIYGHNWTKMLYDKYAKEYPNKRLFSLNRSGFAGSQRYNIFPWTGDVSRSWSGLKAQLPILLGMSMSGVPYVHSDAGGFAGGEGDNELYVRWLQFAAFTPIFRPHGTALYEVDPQAFSFPSEAALIDTPWRNYAKAIIKLRYDLLPYNYTLAYQQQKAGQPIIAPMYYYFDDANIDTLQDQFMWGDQIMVAPVINKSATERKYYLPKGNWFDFFNNKIIAGPVWNTQAVSISDVPVFIKEGSFLVMNGSRSSSNTASYKGDSLNVTYYPSERFSFYELFNDDGRSKDVISAKKYELIQFSSDGMKEKTLHLKITSSNGVYEGKPQRRLFMFNIPLAEAPKQILVNNRSQKFVFSNGKLSFDFSFSGKPTEILLKW